MHNMYAQNKKKNSVLFEVKKKIKHNFSLHAKMEVYTITHEHVHEHTHTQGTYIHLHHSKQQTHRQTHVYIITHTHTYTRTRAQIFQHSLNPVKLGHRAITLMANQGRSLRDDDKPLTGELPALRDGRKILLREASCQREKTEA